jgi:hypothetical protein
MTSPSVSIVQSNANASDVPAASMMRNFAILEAAHNLNNGLALPARTRP